LIAKLLLNEDGSLNPNEQPPALDPNSLELYAHIYERLKHLLNSDYPATRACVDDFKRALDAI
jgi:hypothetical protein